MTSQKQAHYSVILSKRNTNTEFCITTKTESVITIVKLDAYPAPVSLGRHVTDN